MRKDQKFKLKSASDKDLDKLELAASILEEVEVVIAEKFRLSKKDFSAIMDGQKVVDHLVYKNGPLRFGVSRYLKRFGIAAMALALICCFVFEGFADNVRITVVNVFMGPKATRVTPMTYDKSEKLSGYILPTELPEGYSYAMHTQPTGSDMLHVVYSNGEGKAINYFYYPSGASASYDNEHLTFYPLRTSNGTAQVGRDDSGTVILYLSYRNEAFIQMEFEADISDNDLRTIADSLKRQP